MASVESLIEPAFEVIPTDAWWIVQILSGAVVDTATRQAVTVWRYVHHQNRAIGSDCQEVFLGHLEYAFDCAASLCQAGAILVWCKRATISEDL